MSQLVAANANVVPIVEPEKRRGRNTIEAPPELMAMLAYARPHATQAEADFVTRFVQPLPGIGYDKFGNGMLRIGTAPILWSSHTDTVHHKPGRQQVHVTSDFAHLGKSAKRGQCLGADDAAGVWLMCEMARARVPGLYIFHAGEEYGGLGSQYIAKERPDLLKGIEFAVALDRKGTGSIITHQMCGRSCSDGFARLLASKLNDGTGFKYRLDDGGTFTDTAHYTDLIGECSNLSVGYEGAHSHTEELDLLHLVALRDALIRFDPTGLHAYRQPGEIDPADYRDFGDDLGASSIFDKDGKLRPTGSSYAKPGKKASWGEHRTTAGAVVDAVFDEPLIELCRDYPEIAAKLIGDLGCNTEDFLNTAWCEGYDIPGR